MDYIRHCKVGQQHLVIIKRTEICIDTRKDIILNDFLNTLKDFINGLSKGKLTVELEDQELSMALINTTDNMESINYLNLP